jgi:hypothetical protein
MTSRKRQQQRRLKRDLLWAGLGFVLCQLVLGWLLEKRLARARDPEYTAKETRLLAARQAAPDRPLVVALGSSRMLYGLRPSVLASGPVVFNLGLRGAGPAMQNVCLQRLLRRGVRPDFVVIEVTPSMFVEGPGVPREDRHLHGARLRQGEVRQVEDWHPRPWRLAMQWLLARLLPIRRHAAELHELTGLDRPTQAEAAHCGPLGHEVHRAEVTPEEKQAFEALTQRQYARAYQSTQPAEGSWKALEELLAVCQRERIPACLLLMPEGSIFRRMESARARERFDARLADVGEFWAVPVVDGRDWVEDAGFWDGHHMLPAGAEQFTRRFGQEVLPLAESAIRQKRPESPCRR